ncbi:MAG TPA: SDR family oxidoreductase [Steroidobacteraceae bacterium]|jgi:NAD(P)-dependent dehydrogenase (short-subunit alcohol dehydrogenase family)
MAYFVTGATGFIGRYLVERLLARGERVFVLVRPQSMQKFESLRGWWGARASRVVPVAGDLSEPNLGVSRADLRKLTGKVEHLFHLAAVYDLQAGSEEQDEANIVGTDHALQFAESVQAGCFHLTSSIASAGLYKGTFRENMFEEATGLEHPYFRTKHESEAMVRGRCKRPWRVYRPGIVVGHSQTGHIDKVDGPYYFFKALQKLRHSLPPWFPLIGLEGGYINLVPVDFVAAAMDHLAHVPGQDGQCFHLTDPRQRRVGEVLNLFARAGHAPTMAFRVDPKLLDLIPPGVTATVENYRPLKQVVDTILRDLRIPRDVMQFFNWQTRFDSTRAQRLLDGADIRVPPLEDYAWRLWDYWERHLDPDLSLDRSLAGAVRGKVVLITGGSSGIGLAAAERCAEAGAKVVIVARDPEKLEAARAQLAARSATVFAYQCDIADNAACDAFARQVLEEHGGVDVLVNNAGRSIRRSIDLSYDRFHDFERTMQLNYFAVVRLTMALTPSLLERGGHVVNISSIGVLSNAPRFSAYVASKAAMEAWTRCAASEFADRGLTFTIINMPLVRTPMIAPTKIYEQMPVSTPEEAADMVAEAIIARPKRIATKLGIAAEVLHLVAPRITEVVMNTAYRMFPDSSAAKGEQGEKKPDAPPTQEAVVFASILRGVHW